MGIVLAQRLKVADLPRMRKLWVPFKAQHQREIRFCCIKLKQRWIESFSEYVPSTPQFQDGARGQTKHRNEAESDEPPTKQGLQAEEEREIHTKLEKKRGDKYTGSHFTLWAKLSRHDAKVCC